MVNLESRQTTFSEDFVHALEGAGALAVTYNLAAHSLNSISGALSAGGEAMALPVLFNIGIRWGGILGDLILVCFAIGFVTYVVLKFVCESKWVKETVKIKECWKEIKWYNPWSWAKVLVCTIKEVIKWVLKKICKWKEVLVTVLVIVCIAGAIIAAL